MRRGDKQKKAAPVSEAKEEVAEVSAATDPPTVDVTAKSKDQQAPRHSWIRRRWRDVIGVTLFLIEFSLGYVIADHELRPLDSVVIKIWRLGGYVIMSSFFMSWCGTLYHGPGRPSASPSPSETSHFPSHLGAALDAGQFRLTSQFSSKDGWCGICENWKPALASHCKTCQRCCYWMDHHCNLLGQCLGFRNLRCFLVMLCYGQLIQWFLALAIAHRLYVEGLPSQYQEDFVWEWTKLLGSCLYVIQGVIVTYCMLRRCNKLIQRGWPARVLHQKFWSLHNDGIDLFFKIQEALAKSADLKPWERDGQAEKRGSKALGSALADLDKALEAVDLDQRNIRLLGQSIFFAPDGSNYFSLMYQCLAVIFGEERSWRWLLPGRSGGTDSPLSPAFCHAEACEAWVNLGSAISLGRAALAADNSLR